MASRSKASLLLVEDIPTLSEAYLSFLSAEPVTTTSVTTGSAALASLAGTAPDILLLDVNLPDMSGLEVLREARRQQMPTVVIVITSNASINLAVEAMREGAFDFIVKPFSADRLKVTVRNAIERSRLQRTVDTLQAEFGRDQFCGFIGQSLPMQAVYRIIQSAAPSKATVFVTGESGTGKELCAEAIHKLSKRSKGPLVAINCAAIPQELLESEIFGHVKGAFTGATSDRQGAVLSASGGTLFLDEIGELRPDFQAKLLRFLQTGQVQRVGEDRLTAADVRIVCATNRDPQAEVAAGRFREDLFYRLYVIPLELPPLRDREGDILPLARHFLQLFAKEDGKSFDGFEPDAEDALVRYTWPGNIRELQNVMRKLVVLGTEPSITVGMLPREMQTSGAQPTHGSAGRSTSLPRAETPPQSIQPLDAVIDHTIQTAIAHFQGSIPKAAAALKVSPSTIYRRLQAKQAE